MKYFNRFTASGGAGLLIGFGMWITQGGFSVPKEPPPFYWVGIAMMFAGAILSIYGFMRANNPKTNDGKQITNKAKAQEIYTKIMNLETELWATRDNLPKDEYPQNNEEVKKVLANLEFEVHNLATIIDNSNFEDLVAAIMNEYSDFLEFHANAYEKTFFGEIHQIHRRIRWYINHKIKD